jgi:hypothetical protein
VEQIQPWLASLAAACARDLDAAGEVLAKRFIDATLGLELGRQAGLVSAVTLLFSFEPGSEFVSFLADPSEFEGVIMCRLLGLAKERRDLASGLPEHRHEFLRFGLAASPFSFQSV